jgi:digeranylgeranylglycerophospholipid reductase
MRLGQGGQAVQVLDSKPSLDPAPRTLIVTNHFKDQLGTFANTSIVNEIRRFELFTDGRSAEVSLAKPDLVIERARLIPQLAQQAANHGVRISFGTRFVGMSGDGNGLSVDVDRQGNRDELLAQHVVAADGAASRTARSAGWPPIQTVPLVQAIVRLPRNYPADTTRVWFVPDDTPYFYWLIPESAERGALGVIGTDGRDTGLCLRRFLDRKGFDAVEWQGARIPVYRKWVPVRKRLGNGSVYVVGDAAAQVKVSTVGGIVTGFRGAGAVAESILRGRISSDLLGLRRELETHWLLRRTMHHFEQRHYSQLVDLLNAATRGALSEITRDESTRLLWTVLRKQPQLVLLGLRGLLMGWGKR